MNVLALGPAVYNTSPGQRFRMEQWARHLAEEGLRITFAPFEDEALHAILYQRGHLAQKAALMAAALARRLMLLGRAREYDVIYLFREASLIGPAVVERLLARWGTPMVFDFDDAIWVPYASPANSYLSYLKCFGKTATLCRISRHVLAGNSYLAAYARRYNRQVTVVPTTIDTADYHVAPPRFSSGLVTIGWTGSYSTVQHLDTLRPALTALRCKQPFRLMVIGTPAYQLEGVEVQAKPWAAASEVTDLQQFDIGVMPLPDDEWSRGKCGLKLLQCMGVGVPVIGSPVGVNTDIIQEGVNGFLAKSEEDWVKKLALLIENPELRRKIGLAGRKTVDERYSSRHWAGKVRAVFEQVVNRASAGKHRQASSRLHTPRHYVVSPTPFCAPQ